MNAKRLCVRLSEDQLRMTHCGEKSARVILFVAGLPSFFGARISAHVGRWKTCAHKLFAWFQ